MPYAERTVDEYLALLTETTQEIIAILARKRCTILEAQDIYIRVKRALGQTVVQAPEN